MFKPKLFSIIKKKEITRKSLINDMISGIIVAIIALPLSIALGISSGVTPEKGLITAIIAGFFISLLGGSRVQIGGPTGAFVVIVYGIIEKYGIQGLIISTIMAGIILIALGLLKFGTLIKYIPYPITVGFTSGIAVTLFSTQVKDFLGLTIKKVPSEFIEKWTVYIEHMNTINLWTALLGILALAILILWPKVNKKIPGSLIALVVTTLIAYYAKLPVATIGSQFGHISSTIGLPKIPIVSIGTIENLIKPAFTIALLAGIESLLSCVVTDGMINDKHYPNQELIAQGIANISSGIFGGIPATGAIARTAANVRNGGETPVAGVVHAIVLLLIMKIFMPFVKYIPLTCLAAILIIVAYNMSEWKTFRNMLKAPKSDIIVLLVTFFITVIFDLVLAIEFGMIIAMGLFMKKMADNFDINKLEEDDCIDIVEKDDLETENIGKDILVYQARGPLFFGAVDSFINVMDEIEDDAKVLILRLKHVPIIDATAYDAIKKIRQRCRQNNIDLIITEVQKQPLNVIKNMGLYKKLGEQYFAKDLHKAINLANSIIEKSA